MFSSHKPSLVDLVLCVLECKIKFYHDTDRVSILQTDYSSVVYSFGFHSHAENGISKISGRKGI